MSWASFLFKLLFITIFCSFPISLYQESQSGKKCYLQILSNGNPEHYSQSELYKRLFVEHLTTFLLQYFLRSEILNDIPYVQHTAIIHSQNTWLQKEFANFRVCYSLFLFVYLLFLDSIPILSRVSCSAAQQIYGSRSRESIHCPHSPNSFVLKHLLILM